MNGRKWKYGWRALQTGTLLGALLTGAAQAAPRAPAVSGTQFAQDMLAVPDGGIASLRRERAMGYLDGVMDGTAGVQWCPAGQNITHEMGYIVVEDILRLPVEQRKVSAAKLALATLARLYPCPTIGAKP